MRTVTNTLYLLEELSEVAKARAIENVRSEMEERDHDLALQWAIDDCSLFEPPHEEMVALLGENYYEENRTPDGKYGQFVFKNKRRGISLDLDYGEIGLAQPLEITNRKMFLTWLGIPESLHRNVDFDIRDTKVSSTLDLELLDMDLPDVTEIFRKAERKFADHMDYIVEKIRTGHEDYFSEDNVIDRIETMGYEFLEDGTIYG